MERRRNNENNVRYVYCNEMLNRETLGKVVFLEHFYNLICNGGIAYSKVIDMSFTSNISIFISNIGDNEFSCKCQYSADNRNFVNDSCNKLVKPKETILLVPTYFAKYGRIEFECTRKIVTYINVQKQVCG